MALDELRRYYYRFAGAGICLFMLESLMNHVIRQQEPDKNPSDTFYGTYNIRSQLQPVSG